jgi:hypothetical protein
MNARGLLLVSILVAGRSAGTDQFQGQTLFRARNSAATYQLADQFLFVGTDSVRVEDSLLSREKYTIDYTLGILTLLIPVPDSARVVVSYQRLPASELKSSYYRRRELAAASQAAAPETTAAPVFGDTSQSAGSELALSGAKSLAVSFGSNGLDLDQSLRLALKGSIAGVSLDAALSDQGTGVSGEGATRELSELDRVLINVRGAQLRGSLGDIDFIEPQGRLGTITRRLRGAKVVWHSAKAEGTDSNGLGAEAGVSYARPKGRFGHNEFSGTDGRQGPYLLTGEMAGIVIVPGSERVYLDGTQLVRGWDQDYTVDYELGELTFTNRHQIAARSRIEADFEYSTDEYERAILSAKTSYDFGVARVSGGVFNEGDDRNNHLGRGFSPAEQESLAAAGDTDVAWLPGADSVGYGHGDYTRAGDHFLFAGRDSGDFAVRFTLVGDSAGDYEYDNSIAGYRFVGAGNGRYVARQQVRLPERGEAYHVDVKYHALPGLDAALTGLFSRHSRNLFAAGISRTGMGYDGALNWQSEAAGVKYERRSLGTGFSAPGLVSERDLTYTWGVAQIPAVYTRDQLSGFLKPWKPVRLDMGLGWLRSPSGGLDRKRGRLGATAFFADYALERVAHLTRHTGGLQPRIGSLYPAIRVRFDDDTLTRLLETAPEIGWKPREELEVRLGWQRALEAARESTGQQFSNRSLMNTWRADWRMATVRNLDVKAIAGYQQRTGFVAAATNLNQLFANLVSSYANPAGVRARVRLDQKYGQEMAKQEIFVPADSGNGTYSRNPETGEYYPDTLGRYNRVLLSSGRTTPTRVTSADFSGGLFTSQWYSLDLTGQLEQESGDTAALLDNRSGSVTVELLPNSRQITVTVAENASSSFDRRFTDQPERSTQNQLSVELRTSAVSAIAGRLRFELPRRRQTTRDGILEQSESGWQGWVLPVIGSGFNLELTGGYGARVIRMPLRYPGLGEFQIRVLTLGAKRRFELPQKTALTAEARADRRNSTVNQLPYEITLTDPTGWTEELTVSLDRMLGSIVVLSGNYSFRKRPDRAAEHSMTVSLKAYF